MLVNAHTNSGINTVYVITVIVVNIKSFNELAYKCSELIACDPVTSVWS